MKTIKMKQMKKKTLHTLHALIKSTGYCLTFALFSITATAQQTISYAIKTSYYVRHAKGEEKLLTDFDRVNMRSYEEVDSFIVRIAGSGDIETTILHLKSTKFPDWVTKIAKTVIDKKGIRTYDSKGKLLTNLPHDQKALESYNTIKKLTIENGYNHLPAFNKISGNEQKEMQLKGLKVKTNDKGVVHIRDNNKELLYDAENKAVEKREFEGKDLKHSLFQKFTVDINGNLIPFYKKEINLLRTKEGRRLWHFTEQTTSNYKTTGSLPARINTTGNNSSMIEFTIAPNPASNELMIKLPVTMMDKTPVLTIIDAVGRQVVKVNVTSANQTISVQKLAKGIYMLQVQTADGSKQTKRFVKE
jgi:Secretion system C-terminal sorting domain